MAKWLGWTKKVGEIRVGDAVGIVRVITRQTNLGKDIVWVNGVSYPTNDAYYTAEVYYPSRFNRYGHTDTIIEKTSSYDEAYHAAKKVVKAGGI